MTATIYWYDYEAGGVNPRADRPMQFAGIRTDYDLNIIGEPLSEYCQLAPDYLPHPEACLITGITPQKTLRDGIPEFQFANKIHQQFSQAETTICGYNSIRYDDEMTRFLFYRNFIDPYAYSWQDGNSRWDLLTLVQAAYALRPEGIEWPKNEDGRVSLKLDRLAPANGIEHSHAHDAIADVYASIELAKRIKGAQPKLYQYSFSIRRKQALMDLVRRAINEQQPLVHVSGHYGSQQRFLSLILPLGFHPDQANQVIAWRLDSDPEQWAEAAPEFIREQLYTPTIELEGERPGLVTVTLNQCPFLAPVKTLSPTQAQAAGLDLQQLEGNRHQLISSPALREHLMSVLTASRAQDDDHADKESSEDADLALYSGGFLSQQSRSHCDMIRQATPEQLAAMKLPWDDTRMPVLLFRYRARNFPHSLNAGEMQRWQQHCKDRILHGSAKFLSLDDYVLKLEELAETQQDNADKMRIIKALADYIMTL